MQKFTFLAIPQTRQLEAYNCQVFELLGIYPNPPYRFEVSKKIHQR
jgi:hypothetical protein